MRVPDNYDMFEAHEREQQAAMELLPVCDICDQHVQSEYCYKINDTIICESCMAEYYRVETTDLMG